MGYYQEVELIILRLGVLIKLIYISGEFLFLCVCVVWTMLMFCLCSDTIAERSTFCLLHHAHRDLAWYSVKCLFTRRTPRPDYRARLVASFRKLLFSFSGLLGDAIQPSHLLSSPSPAFNLSLYQGLFQWVSSSHQVAKVLEFQL